ncbi:hypothetical protein TNCV_1826031 [Trichonephila clavipes]|nr:hypothetical protein TNCV_1826031 [Trichonephila clavipes]
MTKRQQHSQTGDATKLRRAIEFSEAMVYVLQQLRLVHRSNCRVCKESTPYVGKGKVWHPVPGNEKNWNPASGNELNWNPAHGNSSFWREKDTEENG